MTRHMRNVAETYTHIDDPWRELTRAVIREAAQDTLSCNCHRKNRIQAVTWLQGPDADLFCAVGGVRADTVRAWAARTQKRLDLFKQAKLGRPRKVPQPCGTS